MHRRMIAAALLATLLFIVPGLVAAQQTNATITGFVTDESKSIIAGVKIDVINADTNVRYSATTNEEGIYSVSSLPPGNYKIEVEKTGFKTIVKPDVVLHVQDTAAINFTMAVGSASEIITVEAGGVVMNTTDATVSTVVDRNFVENLPLNGRSFQQLITTAPGVNLTGASSDSGEFSVNGQRPTSNYFTVDGVSANLGAGTGVVGYTGSGETLSAAGGTNAMVSVDALQEFRILTSTFAPEYGRTPGGQVILLTRSGTNDLHGTLFEYFRNTVLDANDWFANQAGAPRSPLQFNDFGGTFGGPIVKSKTFFFFSFEQQILKQPQFTITAVPDAASRMAAPTAIQPLLNAFPVQNGPELGDGLAQFSAGYSNPINSSATTIRLDQVFNQKLTAFVRYSYTPSFSESRGYGGSTSLSDVERIPFHSQSITGGLTYSLNTHLVNETRLNYSQNSAPIVFHLDNFGGAQPVPATLLLVPPYTPVDSFAQVLLGGGNVVRFLAGQRGGANPRSVNITDAVSWAQGAHQLKLGVDYLRLLPIQYPFAQDVYDFGSIANAISNTMDFANVNDSSVRADETNFSLYGQDTWKVSSRLTLTYGLRWDVNTPPRNRYPNNGNYVPLLGNYLTGDVSVGAAGSSLWGTKYTNVAPRFGMAYLLRQASGKETVLRLGAGLFYDVANEGAASYPFTEGFPNALFLSVPGLSYPVAPAQAAFPPVSLTNPAPGTRFYVYPRGLVSPRSWQWNVSLQHALGSGQTVSVSYVAALGRDLLYSQFFPNVGPNGYEVYFSDNSSSSDYQSLQLQYQRRLQHGLAASVSYTWSHSLDDASNDIAFLPPGESLSAKSNWGPSDFDIRHTFNAAVSWSLPKPSAARWIQTLIGGWGLDGIVTARSALPVDIGSYDNNFLGGFNFFLRPDVIPGQPYYLYGSQYPGGKAFNPAAFVVNPNGQGGLGRNSLRGFGLVQTDLSLRRQFQLGEHFKLLFRTDAFNIFNHPNFADPDPNIGDPFFGQSTSMANNVLGGGSTTSLNSVFQIGGPRTLQLSLKLQF